MNLKYLLFGGKGSKHAYYAKRYLTLLIPNFIYKIRRNYLLRKFNNMSSEQREYILDRVNYYCKIEDIKGFAEMEGIKTLAEHKLSNKTKRGYASVYFFDTYEYTRSLPGHLIWAQSFGDVDFVNPLPAITKSRPIGDHNQNNIILKLNKLRHFIRTNDKKSFDEKDKIAVFRGDIRGKDCRMRFVEKYINSTMCDTGDVSKAKYLPSEWFKPKMTIPEQLCHKFIVTLEGNDVASNLKWVMSSNSIAVMPRPTCETWFMEGRLIPNVHYIEIEDDLSDLEERLQYYLDNPHEAHKIIENAHNHWAQFLDRDREDLISHLVLKKYFNQTGQKL
ncbi:MAG: glycosyl transferase family 90 [Rikenellaceae bacterium]